MAKSFLDKAGIQYKVIDAEEDVALTNKFNVRKAPTLLVPNNGTYDVYDNLSFIIKYINTK